MMRFKSVNRQGGFSLLEVLIAVLILGVGLLGVAGLQNATVRSMQSSYERSQAVILLDMLSETLRSDARNARIGAYSIECTHEALTEWNNMVRTALNNPEACVDIEYIGAQEEYILTLSWSDDRFAVGQESAVSMRVSP
jgi:type IV pilus assembly protein PilV